VFPGEPFRAFADQKDVLVLLHDSTGKQHGIPDAAHLCDRASVECAAIHDRRVVLDDAVGVQDRTAARIVEGIASSSMTQWVTASSAEAPVSRS
jgi:hypothetical protein